jgi:hypothetical protein
MQMKQPNMSAEIIGAKDVKEYNYAQTVVLTSDIENFRVKLPFSRLAEYTINRTLALQESLFLASVTKVLYPQAVQDYKNSLVNGFPFNPFGAFLSYTATFNQQCFLSFYYDEYTYTGGAHGNTTRRSNTFNLDTGRNVPLSAYFDDKINYVGQILNIIIEQAENNIKQNQQIYFDDYKTLIKKYFNQNSYYLTPQGIVIYYGQYEIAPYATGIVEFVIPYDKVDFPPNC